MLELLINVSTKTYKVSFILQYFPITTNLQYLQEENLL